MARFILTAQLQLQAPNNVAQVVRQIQSQLNNVNVNIQVRNSQQAQRQLQQVTQSTNQATSAADRMGKAFAMSIRRFAAFSIATRAVGLFTSTLSDAIGTAINFERQLIKISQVTGESMGQLKKLTSTITTLSTSWGVASNDLLNVSTLLLQAGLSSKDTEVALTSLAKAALAPNFDSISQTAEGAIAILAQFQQGVGALEGQLGSINAVAGAFAVEAGDLIDVIRRTGGVFKSSGGSLNELLALFTSVRATTRESAESISTGLRTIFTRIQRPETIEYLKQFGVELVDLEGKFVGPYEAVRRLSAALSGLGERDITFISIAEELGGFRQIGKVLPLLQQFSTAEAALGVAMKSTNTLSADAATAQLALAIRITKVKEEFLALVRSMTETATFQIMANTALALASALIKIGEAIKPILPMLAALAAFKMAKGLGTFVGSVATGLTSGRTMHSGGKVHAFATGGLVPGSGNGDTVPAMLTPGEFVIRKSSVQKLGASHLSGMNSGGEVQKFATGTDSRGAKLSRSGNITKQALDSASQAELQTYSKQAGLSVATQKSIQNRLNPKKSDMKTAILKDGIVGGLFLQKGQGGTRGISKNLQGQEIPGFPKVKQIKGNVYSGLLDGQASSSLRAEIKPAIVKAVEQASMNTMKALEIPPLNIDEKIASQSAVNRIDMGSIEGHIFEAFISAMSGSNLSDPGASFDFMNPSANSKKRLQNIFGPDPVIGRLLDAKRTLSTDSMISAPNSIANKTISAMKTGLLTPSDFIMKNLGGLIQKFATGGGVGTDTIPAMLTPGEFVVNKSSAQRIGYGSLNRMNKVGRYASGGVVQRFKTGGGVASEPSAMGGASGLLQGLPSHKDMAVINKAMTKNSKAFDDLSEELNLLEVESKHQLAAYKALARSLENGEKSEQALTKARAAAVVSISGGSMDSGARGARVIYKRASAESAATRDVPANAGLKPDLTSQLQAKASLASAAASQRQAAGSDMSSKSSAAFAFFAAAGVAALTSMLPPLTETSSSLVVFGHSVLSMVTLFAGLAFTLTQLGVSLNLASAATTAYNVITTILQGATAVQTAVMGYLTTSATAAAISLDAVALAGAGSLMGKAAGGLAQMLRGPLIGALAKFAGGASQLLLPLAATAATLYAINGIFSTIFSQSETLKKSVATGDVEKTRKVAGEEYDLVGANATRMFTGAIGGLVGGLVGFASGGGPFTAALGAAAGAAAGASIGTSLAGAINGFGEDVNVMFGGNTKKSTIDFAVAQSQAVKTQKAFEQGQKAATTAMEALNNGTMSAAEALGSLKNVSIQNEALAKANNEAVLSNSQNKSTGVMAGVRNTLTLGGLIGESANERNTRIDTENSATSKQTMNSQRQAFDMTRPLVNETMKAGIYGNQTDAQINATLQSKNAPNSANLRKQAGESFAKAISLTGQGKTEESKVFEDQAKLFTEQANELDRGLANLRKEIDISRKKFEALNLGFRSVTGASDAAALRMDNLMNSFEVGTTPAVQAMATLEASMTAAGENISKVDFNSALDEVSGVMTSFGASLPQINKFRENLTSIATVQRNFPQIFEDMKAKFKAGGFTGMTAQGAGEEFKKQVDEQLKGAGIGEDVRKRIGEAMGKVELDPKDLAAIGSGDFSVLSKYLDDAGKEAQEAMKGIINNFAKMNQQLIELTKQRIESERNLVAAQQEAIALYLEGREVQAKYGGPAVSAQEQKNAILAHSNVESNRLGLTSMKTGSIEELRNRNLEIRKASAGIELQRRGDNGMAGASGVTADEKSKDLESARKTEIDTIRKFIKAEEDALKIIQEKSALEKKSLESLMNGDIEAFFEQQAAVGAQAAIATGDQNLISAYGGKAIAGAAAETKRQQEAGVQTLYGQQLAGPGGMVERGYGAALGARGVTNPLAAQVMAGTTPEEEASKQRLRDLGGVLSESGQMGVEMSQMKVNTAEIRVAQGSVVMANMATGGAEPQGKALGGLIYASRGMFVPRGTDTIPAMLTPGEFVVNRAAVNRDNNLQVLSAMNSGGGKSEGSASSGSQTLSRGGSVQYLADGGLLGMIKNAIGGAMGGGGGDLFAELTKSLTTFASTMASNIKDLQNLKFKITLDTTTVNVNLTGTSFLSELRESVKTDLLQHVGKEIAQYKVGSGGSLVKNTSTLNNHAGL